MNYVALIGRLGKDPESKEIKGDHQVAVFSLAVESGYGDKKRTDWFRVLAWDRLAEMVVKYTSKGSKVAVQGRLQVREYEKDDEKKQITKLVASSVEFLNPKPENSSKKNSFDEDDDDLPF